MKNTNEFEESDPVRRVDCAAVRASEERFLSRGADVVCLCLSTGHMAMQKGRLVLFLPSTIVLAPVPTYLRLPRGIPSSS